MLSALLGRKIATPDRSQNESSGAASRVPSRSLRLRVAPAGVCALLLVASALVSSPAHGQSVTTSAQDTNAPHAIAINPVTNKIYLADYGGNTITVIDGATNAVSTVTDPPYNEFTAENRAVAVNTSTNYVYVVDPNASTVDVFQGATASAAASWTTSISITISISSVIAVNPITNTVYVTDASSNEVRVINGSTNTLAASISTGSIVPASIAVNSATNLIYVVGSGSGSGELLVIDGGTNAPAQLPTPSNPNPNPIAIGTTPESVAVNPVTNRIYVANTGSNTVSVINGSTDLVLASPVTGSQPVAVAVNPVTNQIYVANKGGSSTSVIDGTTNAVTAVTTDPGTAVTVDTSTNQAYVANSGTGKVTVINGNGGAPYAATPLTALADSQEIAVNPVTHKVYAVQFVFGMPSFITVIDGATNAPATQPTYGGSQPWAIAVDPVGNFIYAADSNSSDVSIIDGASNTVRTTVGVGAGPNAIAVDPINNLIYVSNSSSSSVSVFSGPTGPTGPAGTPSTFSLSYNGGGITPTFLAFNPVQNQVFGAASQGVGFSFGGGSTGYPVGAGQFFAGSTPVAIGTNPAQGYNYAVFSDTSSMQVSDVHGGAGFGVCGGPSAADVNTTTNVIYVACANGNGVDAVEQPDAFTVAPTVVNIPLSNTYPPYPTAVAVNSATNMVYVTDSSTNSALYVINAASNNSVTTINLTGAVLGMSSCRVPVSMALNIASNKIYVLCQGDTENVAMVVAIDGATNAFLAEVQVGTYGQVNNLNDEIAVNPVTGNIYALAYNSTNPLTLFPENIFQTNNLSVTSLGLDPSNANNSGSTTASTSPVFVFTPSNSLVPSGPVTGVNFQVDTMQGAWTQAALVPSPGPISYTGAATNLTPGFHILYAYATDGEDATSGNSGPDSDQDGPVVGAIASYGFLVAPPIATINSYTLVFNDTPVGGMSPSPNPILINEGGAPMTYSWNIGGSNPTEFVPDLSQSSCAASGTLAPNTYCEIYVSFQPTGTGPATATLTWTDNSLGVSNSMQSIGFSGNGTPAVTPPTLTESASNPSYNQDPIFGWSDTEPNVTFQCSFTTGMTVSPSYAPCSSGVDYPGLVENDYYTWSIEAVDASSNLSSPVTVTWQVIPSSVTVTLAGGGIGTVSSSPSGIMCPTAACSAPFDGVSVNLTATPTGNSVFAGWTPSFSGPGDSCSGTAQPCTLNTNNGPRPVTATFNAPAANYTLTIAELGTGSGSIMYGGSPTLTCSEAAGVSSGTCSMSYPSGTPITLSESTSGGTTFTGWSGPCADYIAPQPCSLTMTGNMTVTVDFLAPPQTITVTFPPSSTPVTVAATFNCPGNVNAGVGNQCSNSDGPNATAVQLQVQSSTGFSVNVTATEVPPSFYDGICEKNNGTVNDGSAAVAADFDCRFLQFFNYGTDPATGGAIVPFCVPYSNGNCVHYEVNGSGGAEPDASLFTPPVNWLITWNNETPVPPAPYWSSIGPNTPNIPQLYDDPDSPPTPQSAYGTSCTSGMQIPSSPTNPQSYFCQFEFDITTAYYPNQVVDSGIGGSTKAFNDVVVAWPPTSVPNVSQLPLLNAISTTTPAGGSTNFGNAIGFTMTLTNNGATTANGITLNDPLPSGATWTLGSTSIAGCSITGTSPQNLNCTGAPMGSFMLAPAATATFVVNSTNAAAGIYSNVATFTIGTQQTLAVAAVVVHAVSSSTALTSSANPSVSSQLVTFTATVAPIPAVGDVVTFKNGSATLGTGMTNALGVAKFATSSFLASASPYSITAVFPGDSSVGPSTSSPALSQVVNKANTTTGLISSQNPSLSGQSVTFTATVAAIPSTGDTVTFKDGSTTLGTGTTNASGVATFSTTMLSVASHSITAVFAGDSNYITSTSSILTQTVNAAASSLKFLPTFLNFGNVYVGNTALLSTTITNTGSSMVTFAKFAIAAISGDDSTGYLGIAFCPPTLNAGRSCTIIMSFTADFSVTKTHAANLVITDNGAGSPQTIPMSATVINPKVSLSASSINFGNQTTGTTSAAKSVTLTNSGTTQLNLTSLTVSGTGYTLVTGSSACTATSALNPGATCKIYVTFKPASPKGAKSGSVKIADNAQNNPQTIPLSGNGT